MLYQKKMFIILFLLIYFFIFNIYTIAGETNNNIVTIYELWQEMNEDNNKINIFSVVEDNNSDMGEEVIEDRNRYSKTFQKPGQKEVVLYSDPVHYQDDEGNWKLIDTNIKRINEIRSMDYNDDINFEDGVYDSDFKMKFPGSLEQGIKLIHGDFSLVMKLKDAKSEYNEVAGSMKKYIEVWDNVDVQYNAFYDVLKESIILKNKNARNSFNLEIKMNNELIIEESETGLILSNPVTEEEVFEIGKLFVFDNNTIEPDYDHVNWEYQQQGKIIKMEITVDQEWLNSSERSFPVIIDPWTKTIKSTKNVYSYNYKFKKEKNQIIKWEASIDVKDHTLDTDIDLGKFYIKKDNQYIYGPIERGEDEGGDWNSGIRYLSIEKEHEYEFYVRRHKSKFQAGLKRKYDYGTTWAKITFYDEPTLIPSTPKLLDNNGNTIYYSTINNFNWTYSDKQNFLQKKVNIVIKKKNSNGEFKPFLSTDDINYSSQTYDINNDQFDTGEYQWQISGYNGKIWSDSSSWQPFYVDKLPPWPSNGFRFDASLNLTQTSEEETIKDAYTQGKDLEYTLEWNKFVDKDEDNRVGSGVKEQILEYSKDGADWQNVNQIGSDQAFSNFIVEWNSNYKFRIRGEDKVGNISELYPLNKNYPEFNTPSMPTKIKDINFTDKLINIEFNIHDLANAYKIKWKNIADDTIQGETEWIRIPDDYTEASFTYVLLPEDIGFRYNENYEFSIATCNTEDDEYIVYNDPTSFRVANQLPLTPELQEPEDNLYSKINNVVLKGNTTTDPDGHQLEYSFLVEKLINNQSGETEWIEYKEYIGQKTDNGVEAEVILEDGHYRWKLVASDGLEESFSSKRMLYIDTIAPKEPNFQFQSESGLEIDNTNKNQIIIYLKDYSREYEEYPYPDDKNMFNDVDSFEISSNLDKPVTVNKMDLLDDILIYAIEEIDGEHEITVKSYDKTGNMSSNNRNIIFDCQKPDIISFIDSTDTYLHNTVDLNNGAVLEFNWPDGSDNPTDVINSGIKGYLLEFQRPDSSTTELMSSNQSLLNLEELNYNEEVKFKVKAVDNAGNEGQWSEDLSWFTAAEPTELVIDENIDDIIKIKEIDNGLYQKSLDLSIKPAEFNYYKIHRINLSNIEEEELITDPINGNLQYNQSVDPHQKYQYFIKTYNEMDLSTDGNNYGLATDIYISNSLPTIPEITFSGVNEMGYLNTDSTVVNISSKDIFDNRFEHCVDYDNDNLSYHYLVREDEEIIVEEDSRYPSLSLADLKNGSTYEIQVDVTDNIKNNNGEIEYVSSDFYTFTVDNEGPEITVTAADDGYVPEKIITVSAFDSISQVKNIKYSWGEDGELKTLPENNKITAPHGANILNIIAIDNAGNETFVSNLYRVDTTAPEINTVQVQGTQAYNGENYIRNNNHIYLDLDFSEDLTNIISYHYGLIEEHKVVTNITLDDLMEVKLNGINSYKGEQLIEAELVDGKKYYPVIMVKNSAGRSTEILRIEPGFYVDASIPEIEMNIKGLVENQNGSFLTDREVLDINTEIDDQETGIKEIYYGISNNKNSDNNWFSSLDVLKDSIDFIEGETYYLAVKAVNSIGLANEKYSQGFIVDTKRPEFIRLVGGEELPAGIDRYIQRRNDYLKVTWTISDISRISNYYYKIGTSKGTGNISQDFEEADSDGWIEYSSNNYQDSIIVRSPDNSFADGIYYITIKAIDEAGNESTASTNSIEINSHLDSVPTIKTGSIYLDSKDNIYFTIEIFNPEQEIAGYLYWIEDSAGKIVLNHKTIDTDQNIIDIEESELSLEDGEDYFIFAQVCYIDGIYSDSGFTKVTVDSTPPEISSISTPEFASKQELKLSWIGEEDYSLIEYKMKIGTEINSANILDWVDIGRKEQVTFNNLEIADEEIIYVTLQAINSSGLTDIKVSKPIIIDNTPPPVPVVIDEGLYSTDNTKLSIDWRWTLPDEESGIMKYEVALLTSRNIDENIDWINIEKTKTNYTFTEQLINGENYFMAVRSINGAGLSSTGLSDGILIDITKPEPPQIDDHGDYSDSLTTLEGTFSGSLDPESGIASFYYSLGTYLQPSLLINEEEVDSTIVGDNNLNLQVGDVYFFTAEAKNNAGLLSAQTLSNGIKIVEPDRPKVVKVEDGGEFTVDNERLNFVWMLDDISIPFDYYEYALLDSQDATIKNWLTTVENQISINAEDIYGEDSRYEDGKTYYLAVRAVNMLGSATTVKISDGITVDSTPPNTPVIGVAPYTNESFNLKWSSADSDTMIVGYEYAIGTSRGGTEISNGWNYIDVNDLEKGESRERIDRVLNLNLEHEGRYYLTVRAVNETGLWSLPARSSVIIADLENPVTPIVNTESAEEPSYSNNKNIIKNMSFVLEDRLSGIAAYRYQVVDNKNLTGDLSGNTVYTDRFLNIFKEDNLDIQGLDLIDGKEYYLALQAMDRTGNLSSIGYSQTIIIDTTLPILKIDNAVPELVTNDGSQDINWSTNEGGAIYYRIFKLDENGSPLTDPEFNAIEINTYSGEIDINLKEYGRYEFQVYQVDLAGNNTGIMSQIVRYNQPPIVSITGDLSTYKGHSITFTGQVNDDAGLDKYIWKIGEYEVVKTVGVDTDPEEFKYEFLEIGNYQIELEVFDVDGLSTRETIQILITNTLEGKLILDETWSGNMEMRGTVQVPEGITLTIEPGTTVSFPDSAFLLVAGGLIINGNMDNIITLTGTYWSGLLIRETADITELNFLLLSNAKRGLVLEKQNPMIENSSFIDNEIGIHLISSSPKIKGCNVSQNQLYGIKEEIDSIPEIVDSEFAQNGNDYYHYIFTNISIDRLNSLNGNFGNIGQ